MLIIKVFYLICQRSLLNKYIKINLGYERARVGVTHIHAYTGTSRCII